MVRSRPEQNQRVQAPTGLPQGERMALENAQRAIPLPSGGPSPQGDPSMAAAQAMPPTEGLLTAPTSRPEEPLTAGLPMGPGVGPSPMAIPMGDPDAVRLAPYLPMLEALADRPDASALTRNWVRRLRSAIPPNIDMKQMVQRKS